MNELIAGLAALLDRGIVVEPVTESAFGPIGYRIRLATADHKTASEQEAIDTDGEKGLTW